MDHTITRHARQMLTPQAGQLNLIIRKENDVVYIVAGPSLPFMENGGVEITTHHLLPGELSTYGVLTLRAYDGVVDWRTEGWAKNSTVRSSGWTKGHIPFDLKGRDRFMEELRKVFPGLIREARKSVAVVDPRADELAVHAAQLQAIRQLDADRKARLRKQEADHGHARRMAVGLAAAEREEAVRPVVSKHVVERKLQAIQPEPQKRLRNQTGRDRRKIAIAL